MAEDKVISSMLMDRAEPLGNSNDALGRRALHVRQTSGALVTEPYNEIQASYPSDNVEVYTYFLNSVLQTTITITYTDDTKAILLNVIKT